VAILGAAWLVYGALLFARRPDALIHPQMWAEDAVVFFDQADRLGVRSLVRPNAGYFHTLPRCVALLAGGFDPAAAPAFYNYAAWAIGLAAAALVGSWSAGERGVARFGFPLALLCAPHLSQEIFLSLTNIQWVVAPCLLLPLLADPPRRPAGLAAYARAMVLIAGTTPFASALLPLWVVRLIWGRNTANRVPLAGAILGGLAQVGALATASRGEVAASFMSVGYYFRLIGNRLIADTLGLGGLWPSHPVGQMVGGVVGLGLLAAATVGGGWRGNRRIWLGGAMGAFFLAVAWRIHPGDARAMLDSTFGDRYFYCIRVLLLWLVLLVAGDARNFGRGSRIAAVGVLVLAAVASARSFTAEAWLDYHWERYAGALRAGRPVDIPINPDWVYHYGGRPAETGVKAQPAVDDRSGAGQAAGR